MRDRKERVIKGRWEGWDRKERIIIGRWDRNEGVGLGRILTVGGGGKR